MYTSKKFSVKPMDEVFSDIDVLSHIYKDTRKVFIADGNAFCLSRNKLAPILEAINSKFGRLQRISSYALPKDIIAKSDEDLKALRELGLKLLYIGIETGNDELLEILSKGETFQTTKEGIARAHNAGIETSVMIITGIGGKNYSEQHALESARIINAIKPKYLSTLTLSLPFGLEHYRAKFRGNYQPLNLKELLIETKTFIENLDLSSTIFRSDHVSNNLVLKGTLPKDKSQFLETIQMAILSA
jgi:radical SAM superfamily enzyme YgiQ (UPF0313 family)